MLLALQSNGQDTTKGMRLNFPDTGIIRYGTIISHPYEFYFHKSKIVAEINSDNSILTIFPQDGGIKLIVIGKKLTILKTGRLNYCTK